MSTFSEQYDYLWDRLTGNSRAHQIAVGGDFDVVGTLEFELLRSYGLKPTMSVIDVGCGSGRLATKLAPWLTGPYLGTDILQPLLDSARESCGRPDWRFERTDGQVIPAPDESADIVCFFSVLTHITHEQSYKYLLEAKRVLKPRGLLICSFLEFRIRSHWAIFRNDLKDPDPGKILNQFMGRDSFEAFAFNAGLEVVKFHDGDKPHIPIKGELVFENGHRVRRKGNLGQSVCVLRKPRVPVALPL